MDDLNQSEAAAEPAYSYKPSLMGAPWLLQLKPDHLAWTIGRRSGTLAYRDIAKIRMSFRPVTMQTRRYLTEIWAPGSPKLVIASASWRSMVEQTSLAGPYSDFVRQLHARVAASGGKPRCEGGLNPFKYWPGAAVFAALLLGMTAMILRASQESSWQGALFILGFMALFVWQIGNFFRLNKPVRYEPAAPPADLLPRR